jgi:hypothetical protein
LKLKNVVIKVCNVFIGAYLFRMVFGSGPQTFAFDRHLQSKTGA